MKKSILILMILVATSGLIGCNILNNPMMSEEEPIDNPSVGEVDDSLDFKNYADYFFLNDGSKYEYIYKDGVNNEKHKVRAYRKGDKIQYLYNKNGNLYLELMKVNQDGLTVIYSGEAGDENIEGEYFDKEQNKEEVMFKGRQEKNLKFGEYVIEDTVHDIYSMEKDIITNMDNVTKIVKNKENSREEFYYLMPYGIVQYKKISLNGKKEKINQNYYIIEATELNPQPSM